MDRKAIEERLAKLKAERDQLTAALRELPGRIQAYHGAIQDCEHWLTQIDKADEAAEAEAADEAAAEEKQTDATM